MRLPTDRLLAVIALSLLPSAWAFKDTSPFFLVSSSSDHSNVYLSTSEEFISKTRDIISQCNSDAYILVSQPGVHASDFEHGKCFPNIKREFSKRKCLELTYGKAKEDLEMTVGRLEWWAREKCGAELVQVDASTGSFQRFDDMKPKVVKVDFPEIKSDDEVARCRALANADTFLFSIISLLPTKKWTLIYTSSPRETIIHHHITSPQESHPHHEGLLKRSKSPLFKRDEEPGHDNDDDTTPKRTDSLFKKYRFFSPGIYMGYIAAFFLLTIGYVGLSGIASLKVSYAAFEKDPVAKKQQ